MRVQLGNTAPVEVIDGARRALGGPEVATVVVLPDDATPAGAFVDVTSPRGVWVQHSDQPPAWVASDNGVLAQLLSSHYGCPIRAITEV